MAKVFNVTANCIPEKHYMIKLDTRLTEIKKMVDSGAYFTINRARQFGKTTTIRALARYLQEEYYVVSMDFQTFGHGNFGTESVFSKTFLGSFFRALKRFNPRISDELKEIIVNQNTDSTQEITLGVLFEKLEDILDVSDKPIILIIDEVDSATNNQVFLDFLAQLRACYINRDVYPAFHSVILAGVHDVKNLRRKIRPEEARKINSPWNIAADFKVDMSFSAQEIAEMLREYENDHHTGMNITEIAELIYDYTSGYPYLVSRLCKYMDEDICQKAGFDTKGAAWTKNGFHEAVKMLVDERSTLFDSLSEKLLSYPELNTMLRSLLFMGKAVAYNYYEPSINIATMFGFVKNQNNTMVVANRIFEIWLYNYYLSTAEMHQEEMYTASLRDKNQFIENGCLNMRLILEKFVLHFHDLYGDSGETFLEEEGRKYFLLYLRPIINGVGNYYIESQTRELRRTDIIVDYYGIQYIIEMKIWHGNEYNARGEQQLVDYLDAYHQTTGYMLSFNFNKNKQIGVREILIGDKTLIEAVV